MLSRRRLLTFGAPAPVPDEAYWLRIARTAMACSFEAVLDPREGRGGAAARVFLDEVDRLESLLSIFRPSSELSRVNREAALRPVTVGQDLFELLQLCRAFFHETEGAFDVTAGALSECWGFEARRPGVPSREALAAARACVGFQHVTLGADRTVAVDVHGLKINLGGIGKGYALDRGASAFEGIGVARALLSAGHSSVVALGAGDGGAWPVALRHPMDRTRSMGTVYLDSCALATSGAEEQFFEQDGRRYGHLLDPRTGWPADEVTSASVVADGAADAEALATAFFVGGPALAEAYCARHADVAAVLLLRAQPDRPVVIGAHARAAVEVMNG